MNKIRDFRVTSNGLIITSSSGNEYQITKDSCSCKAFAFRRKCGHFKEAKANNLLDLLNEQEAQSGVVFKMSKEMKGVRKEALRIFLRKSGINFKEEDIDLLEPMITKETHPKLLLQYFQ